MTAKVWSKPPEVPVGFKWFVPGLLDGSLGFGVKRALGALFLWRNGTVWTADKDWDYHGLAGRVAHGAHYGWPPDAKFLVPDGVREHFQEGIGARGLALHRAWRAKFEEYRRQYPELADEGYRMLRRELPDGWDKGLPTFSPGGKAVATRDASGQALNALAKNLPWLLGGSADLGPSCKTRLIFEAPEIQRAESRRAESPLRDSRACCGRYPQWPVPVEDPTVWIRVPDLLRLRARGNPLERSDGNPGDPRLYP